MQRKSLISKIYLYQSSAANRSADLYMSYMVYHATGEGVMSCIAVAGSKHAAEHLMKGKLPEHYHRATVTRLLDSALDEDAKKMLQLIPGPTKNFGRDSTRGRRVLRGHVLQLGVGYRSQAR